MATDWEAQLGYWEQKELLRIAAECPEKLWDLRLGKIKSGRERQSWRDPGLAIIQEKVRLETSVSHFQPVLLWFQPAFSFTKSNYNLSEILLFCTWSLESITHITRRASHFWIPWVNSVLDFLPSKKSSFICFSLCQPLRHNHDVFSYSFNLIKY